MPSKTINFDNARLNCRIDGLDNKKPDLFIIDLKLKLKKNLILNKLLNKRKTYLITLNKNYDKISFYKKLGFKIILISSLYGKKDFNNLYVKIYKMGYSRIFFETGLILLNHLIKNKLINDLYIFKGNKKLGKKGKNNSSSVYLKKILPKLPTIDLNGDKLFKKEF